MDLRNQNTAAVPNGGNLPQEIITDLLSRLPVKTLCRFKCVSPSWKSLISDPYFAKTHLNQTNSLNTKNLHQKVIILFSCGNLYSLDLADVNLTTTKLDFPPVRTRVLSSYDGLLLVSHNDNSILLNPSTREHKVLPTLPFAIGLFPMRAYVIGYDSSTDDYKVAIISNYCPESESSTWRACTLVAVYSRKTNAWRRIQDTDHILVKRTGSAVFCNGCLHYFGRSWSTGSYGIVAFDLSDEIFQEVLPPASFTTYELSQYNMKVFGGRLCLFDQRNYQIGFWMMEEYGVRDSWTKFSIDMPKMSVELLFVFAKDELLLKTRQKVLDNRGKRKTISSCTILKIEDRGAWFIAISLNLNLHARMSRASSLLIMEKGLRAMNENLLQAGKPITLQLGWTTVSSQVHAKFFQTRFSNREDILL